MEEKTYSNIYAIPANYTDSGKILGGMLEPRNTVETLLLVTLVGYPELALIPMPGMIRVVVMVLTLLPLAVVSLMGIDGDSLGQYLGHILRFALHRRILHYRRVGGPVERDPENKTVRSRRKRRKGGVRAELPAGEGDPSRDH